MSLIRILIADDHPIVRSGISGLFADRAAFAVVGEAENGAQAVEMAATLQPDIILMDLRMPILSGLEAMRRILKQNPEACILVLTTYDSDQDILEAIKVGAKGYLLKDSSREEILQAVQAAALGRRVMGMTVSMRLLEQHSADKQTLTERDIAVLALAAQGSTNKAIGTALHISEATVKTHLKHIYLKLGVSDRAAAVALALERKIIRLS